MLLALLLILLLLAIIGGFVGTHLIWIAAVILLILVAFSYFGSRGGGVV